jgi:hypothetical protein
MCTLSNKKEFSEERAWKKHIEAGSGRASEAGGVIRFWQADSNEWDSNELD